MEKFFLACSIYKGSFSNCLLWKLSKHSHENMAIYSVGHAQIAIHPRTTQILKAICSSDLCFWLRKHD